MLEALDPHVPRPLDQPTAVPLDRRADLRGLDTAKILAAPDDPVDWPTWREQLSRWRRDARARLAHNSDLYDRADLAWTRRCVVVTQVWLWDELLYDWAHGTFTPERFLDDAERRFGGFDGVLLWHAYPVIGIDDRNQWDYYRLVPGLRALVDHMHERGVRVFVDYTPWDTGSRRGGPDEAELASLVHDLDADGVFLDTLKQGGAQLLAAVDRARPGVAVEGESTLPLERLADHPMSWAQWFADSAVPGVIRARLFEPRHQLHHVRRWHRDHFEEIRSAWLNGVGMMVWEVVFGVWVGWNDADRADVELLSRTLRALADLVHDGDWEPLTDLGGDAAAHGVHASRFTHAGACLLTVANSSDTAYELSVPGSPEAVDVATGAVLGDDGGPHTVTVPPKGIAGVWFPAPGDDRSWLPAGPACSTERTRSFNHRRAHRNPVRRSTQGPPRGIPSVRVAQGEHTLTARYRCRETGMYQGAPFVDEWKPLPPRLHDQRTLQRTVRLDDDVHVASAEVTAAEFLRFVEDTGHRPAKPTLLEPWWAAREPRGGRGPATEVDLDDARAYAAWLGGRLPTEDEWQLAAASPEFTRLEPAVWNLTESEFSDGRTRFSMLKGGSAHLTGGSDWYFDGGVRHAAFAAKYLMPGSGLGRSTSIGFRCAWDGAQDGS
jgi:hypothetical protein